MRIDEKALYKLQYGMYIITSKLGDKLNGQIATTVMQVTNTPIQISVCLSKNTLTHEMVTQSKVFGVSVLSQDTPMLFIGRFGFKCGRDMEKCENINYEQIETGSPLILDNALVIMEATVEQVFDIGTHSLFIGLVKNAKTIKEGIALTYEYYQTVIKGKSPQNAPTYHA